jgi:hypothetical protein
LTFYIIYGINEYSLDAHFGKGGIFEEDITLSLDGEKMTIKLSPTGYAGMGALVTTSILIILSGRVETFTFVLFVISMSAIVRDLFVRWTSLNSRAHRIKDARLRRYERERTANVEVAPLSLYRSVA